MNESSSPIGFVAPEPSELAPLFPGYEIHDLIATGGMGAVYRVVQKSLDRTVALKILPLEFSEDAEFCARFEAEAKAMARLNHPNLISVYDFGEVNGMLYIVMEFVPGKSIYHSAHGRLIDPEEVVRLVTGICNGLAHAHENGILHRDIKPSNILLTPNVEPKIGDFGLACPIGVKTQAGEVIYGTPGYTAPEVIEAPHTVDHRADVFSTGVMLHELLTGKLPADDPRPASRISGCDARFDAIIRRATAPAPANRYNSATEITTDLQKITAAPLTAPGAMVHGVPKADMPRPHMPRRATTAGVKRKTLKLTWVGPLLAIAVMGYSIHTLITRKPKIIMIENPAAKSSPSGIPAKELDQMASRDASQTSLPSLPPPPSQLPPAISNPLDFTTPEPDGEPANENLKTSPQNQRGSADFLGDWDAQEASWRIRIKDGGVAIIYFYKDRDRGEILNQSDSIWKQGDAPNQIIIYQYNTGYLTTCTMDSGGDSFESINPEVHKYHYSRVAKTVSPKALAKPDPDYLASLKKLEALHSADQARAQQPLATLQENYRKILEKYEGEAKTSGNYKSLFAVRGAIAVIPDLGAGRAVVLSEDANIAKLEIAYVNQRKIAEAVSLKALAKIDQDYLASLRNLATELAKAGQTEVAVKAQNAADQFAAQLKDANPANPTAESPELALWKKKALEEFPALKDPTSVLSQNVKALRETKERMSPGFSKNSQWPYLLAKEASLALQQAARGNPLIPAGAKSFNNKKYFVYEDKCTWKNARNRCEKLGGHLAVIPDETTQIFIHSLDEGRLLWLGATDEKIEGSWIWLDGTKMDFRKFSPREPGGDRSENYLVFGESGWQDYPDSGGADRAVIGYICEWPDENAHARNVSIKENEEAQRITSIQTKTQLSDRLADTQWLHKYKNGESRFTFARSGLVEGIENWKGVKWMTVSAGEVVLVGTAGATMSLKFDKEVKTYTSFDWGEEHTPTTGRIALLPPDGSGEAAIKKKLESIVIPKIDFEDTTLDEAIDFLRLRCSELDQAESDPHKKGLNFVVTQSPQNTPPRLNLRLQNIAAAILLKYLADQVHMRIRINESFVELKPIEATDTPELKATTCEATEAAAAIIIPRVDFEDATLDDVVLFMNLRIKELAQGGKMPVLSLDAAADRGARIHALRLKNVSVLTLVSYVAASTNHRVIPDGNTLRFTK